MKKYKVNIICSIFGIIFLVIGYFTIQADSKFMKTALSTNATVTLVTEKYVGSNDKGNADYDYENHIQYMVNGQSYNATIKTDKEKYASGYSMKILYDPDNPTDVRQDTMFAGIGGYIMVIVGGILFLIFAIILPIYAKRYEQKMAKSKTIQAKFVGIEKGENKVATVVGKVAPVLSFLDKFDDRHTITIGTPKQNTERIVGNVDNIGYWYVFQADDGIHQFKSGPFTKQIIDRYANILENKEYMAKLYATVHVFDDNYSKYKIDIEGFFAKILKISGQKISIDDMP